MPELPEVETIRIGLQKYLIGHRIKKVSIRLQKIVYGDSSSIINAEIIAIERFGKGLVIELDNGYAMGIHIKMTGQLIYVGEETQQIFHPSQKVGGDLPNKFTHVIFYLDRGALLYYNDIRQFGWIKIVKKDEIKHLSFFKGLGPEPLRDLSIEMFTKIVLTASGPIKPLLMDQKKISGIGNIYANDALYRAHIDPKRKANMLLREEINQLFDAIEFVLKKGLEYGGASEVNFVNVLGGEGGYQHHFLVYGQDGKSCKRCGAVIEKIFLAGRGTFYCPNCQV